ncbi:MAG: thiamine phosphate synthase [Planctomycetota bacterium]
MNDRAWLSGARLMLLFTPELCRRHAPLDALERTLESIDAIQIRPKALGSTAPGGARETFDWCVRVLDLLESKGARHIPVIVNDRVDVAEALRDRGCAGVHLGQDDCPVRIARQRLGLGPVIGLSTHDMLQVANAGEEQIDYLGFGPIHGTRTRGYEHGLGPETAWIASAGSSLPVFAIGGVDASNAADLARVGRAAVGSAILSAEDPGRAAREIRSLLEDQGRSSIASP